MLASDLSEELRDLAGLVRKVAETQIDPLVDQVERSGTFSAEVRAVLAESGLLGLVVPEEFGGAPADVRHEAVVLEGMARVYPSACTYLTAHWLATKLIASAAVDHERADWMGELLTDAATGSRLGAIAATEPEAGSDLGSVVTRAERQGADWVLNGTKRFITNGGFADFYTVLARTGGPGSSGLSLIFVEADRPGLTAARWEEKMGLHGSATAEMHFDDVRVPTDHIIGEEGRGFNQLMQCFDEGRIGVAAMSLGIADRALEIATDYATQRRQFGRPIASFQGVQFLIADMSIAVHASRSLIYDAARAVVDGHPNASRLAAIAKTFASDAAMKVTSDAVQALGGSGYMRDFRVEMLMRDAKINQIYEGTNQVLRMLIARSYIGDAAR